MDQSDWGSRVGAGRLLELVTYVPSGQSNHLDLQWQSDKEEGSGCRQAAPVFNME